jgi:hypothetical protein
MFACWVKADVAEGQERQAATLVRRRNGSRLHLRDRDGQKFAYVYFEDEPGRRSAAKLLTRDKARRALPHKRRQAGNCCARLDTSVLEFLGNCGRIHSLRLHPHAETKKKATNGNLAASGAGNWIAGPASR